MKNFGLVLGIVFGLVLGVGCASAQAQTFTHRLTWTLDQSAVDPVTAPAADQLRIEEKTSTSPDVWTARATVPATDTQYDDTGNGVGLATYRIMPMLGSVDGTPSNETTCGAVAPGTTVSVTCSAIPE